MNAAPSASRATLQRSQAVFMSSATSYELQFAKPALGVLRRDRGGRPLRSTATINLCKGRPLQFPVVGYVGEGSGAGALAASVTATAAGAGAFCAASGSTASSAAAS